MNVMTVLKTLWEYFSVDSRGKKSATRTFLILVVLMTHTRWAMGGLTLPLIGVVPTVYFIDCMLLETPFVILFAFREWMHRNDETINTAIRDNLVPYKSNVKTE